MFAVLLTSLACQHDQGINEVEPEDPGTPAPYLVEEPDASEAPLLTAEELAAGITEGLDTLMSMDPRIALDAYELATAGEDSSCPTYYYDKSQVSTVGYWYWYASCSTQDSTRYSGYAYGIRNPPYTSGDYTYDEAAWLYANARITTPEGHSFQGAGYLYVYDYLYYGYRYTSSYGYGDFAWDGEGSEGTWLAADGGFDLSMSTGDYGGGSRSLTIASANLGGLKGPANAVRIEDLFHYTALAGSPCPAEPSGTISLRDTHGTWYEVRFHGPAGWGAPVFPPDCDGCGQAWANGEPMGLVCPDLSLLNSWEGAPW